MDLVSIVDRLVHELAEPHSNRALADAFAKRSGKSTFDLSETAGRLPWGWAASTFLDILEEYPAGLTRSIILTEVSTRWDEPRENRPPNSNKRFAEIGALLEGNTTDQSLFNMTVINARQLDHTEIWILTLQPDSGGGIVEAYLHQRFYILTAAGGHHLLTHLPRRLRFCGAHVVRNPKQLPRLLPTPFVMFELSPAVLECSALRYRQPRESQSFSSPSLSQRVEPAGCPRTEADRLFAKTYFTTDFLTDVTHATLAGGQRFRFWVKVGVILADDVRSHDGRIKRAQIFVSDVVGDGTGTQSTAVLASLVLWDDQVPLASLVNKGDYLGIYLPTIKRPANASLGEILEMEYGPDTILFILPRPLPTTAAWPSGSTAVSGLATAAPAHVPSSVTAAADEDGITDCRHAPQRIYIADLRPLMSGLTLFGRIMATSHNQPVTAAGDGTEDSQQIDRFIIRLVDETGATNVTCWGTFGLQAARCRVGEWVLISNVITTAVDSSASAKVHVEASERSHSQIRSVYTRRAFLSCSYLRDPVPLTHIINHPVCQSRVVIVGWRPYAYAQPEDYVHPPNDHLNLVVYTRK
ncbi:hypothetical protein IWQ60_000337 [Tieghemiomyces parasiticus]|uniref:Uncharacterized protein n=1 Tax=Tieghemiomyces parasiticus TaxID=78921 RepID=A0A9W8E2V3_9FUNG|nr:hypothetical protein IWQ60_000337 [Tieghemiomyces parasiticus]